MTKRSMCSCANQYRYPSDTWTESQLPTSLTDEIYIYSRQILIERKKIQVWIIGEVEKVKNWLPFLPHSLPSSLIGQAKGNWGVRTSWAKISSAAAAGPDVLGWARASKSTHTRTHAYTHTHTERFHQLDRANHNTQQHRWLPTASSPHPVLIKLRHTNAFNANVVCTQIQTQDKQVQSDKSRVLHSARSVWFFTVNNLQWVWVNIIFTQLLPLFKVNSTIL